MYKENALQNELPMGLERLCSFKVIACQGVGVGAITLIWLVFKGFSLGLAAFLGGLASLVPSFILTWYLFATITPQSGKRMALVFALGEFLKLIVSGLTVGFLIVKWPHAMLPIVTGFMGALLGLWLAPLIINIDGQEKRVIRG